MVPVGQNVLTLQDFSDILFKGKPVKLTDAALNRVEANFSFLKEFGADKLIYGLNTGFGPMAQYKVGKENLLQLQYNLIRSHCSGEGLLLDPVLVKGLMVARLNSLMQGYSGIHPDTVKLLVDLINKNITPCIYEHGGVGASGDLVQLAHLALAMIGEGEVVYENNILPTGPVFQKLGIKPLCVHMREGIALINGTSAMTGIGLINVLHAKNALGWSALLSALTNELVESYDDHYSNELNRVKPHKGQNFVAGMLRDILKGSKMIRNRSEHWFEETDNNRGIVDGKVQEYYSLRCVPQILGPIYDTISQAEISLVDELNSVNDNPIISHEDHNVFHGGNFHGDYVSLEMDKLKISISKLSMLSERQINFLMNNRLNEKFPPFLNLGIPGLNFGMQGVQFTATSIVAENQTLSFPMYIHSIPNNNDNQDIVSMGCNSAMMARRVIENSFAVLAIQLMSLLQAIGFLDCQDRLAPWTLSFYSRVKDMFPKFVEDQPKFREIQKIKTFLENTDPYVPFF